MADNIAVTEGSGKTVATDEISDVHYQVIKLAYGALGTATLVESSAGLPVTVSGVATSAKQDTQTTALQAIQAALEIMDDWDESNRAGVNLISSQVGVQGGSGAVSANTLRAVLATDVGLPAGTNNIGDVDIASIAPGDNNIGNVDIVTVPADPFGANADASSATGSISGKLRYIATNMALESGGNLAAIATSAAILDDWDESDRAKVNAIVGQAGLQGGSGSVSANTLRVVLATDVALPAGTNNIGDVDVLSVTDSQSSLDHGSNLDIDTVAEQITSTSFSTKRGVLLRAPLANTGTLYIGNSDVTASGTPGTDGVPLEAGESIFIPVNNPNLLYAIASANNQAVYWMAV